MRLAILSPSACAVLEVLERSAVSVGRRELRVMAGVRNDREMRDALAELVEAGFPVVRGKGGEGYRLTDSPQEIDAELQTLNSYVLSLQHRRDGLARAKARLTGPGQRHLFAEPPHA